MEASRLDRLPEVSAPSRIGERLREARQSQGLTARDVAKRVGVSPSLISQIERDKVNPSVSTLWGLVTVLGLTMSDLFSEVDGAQHLPSAPAASAGGAVDGTRVSRRRQSRLRRSLGATDGRERSARRVPLRRLPAPAPNPATRTRSYGTAARSTATSSAAGSGCASASTSTSSGPGWRSPSIPRPRIACGRSATRTPRRSGSSSAGRATGVVA